MMRQHTRMGLWLLALAVAAGFAGLGHWQWQRMQAKQRLLDTAAHVRDRTVALPQALARPPALAWVEGRGRFLPQRILLDNQTRDGRAGVRVYQPFEVQGAPALVLVDLGWLALPPDRRLPSIPPVAGPAELRGLLAPPPSAGLALGPAMAPAGQASTWLATRIDPDAVAQALGGRDISSQVLRLDPALPLGYARDLDLLPNTLPPARHLAYAVQWFGLALAVLVTAGVLEGRRRRQARRAAKSTA
ncbi:SURF1 family protein [[Pseudomonas] boreopolis]|uniref:SURF1 family protein n=2 Tax=Gammaproteobacteria TaxID=1236 RepID=UPI00112D1898